jgi:protein arginine kinase
MKMKSIIVKSKVQLSRNVDLYPFPAGLTFDASLLVLNTFREIIGDIDRVESTYLLVGMDEDEKDQLHYDGLIPNQMLRNTLHSGFLQGNDLTYLINGEDHLSLVAEDCHLPLKELWDKVVDQETKMAKRVNFSFDLKLGYLTSRITEIGTGLKISVVLHLPGIMRTDYIGKLSQAVHQVGFSLKPYAINGQLQNGAYYELSNQVTIGKTEDELIDGLLELVDRIAKKEGDALDTLQSAQDKVLEDELYRAYGILKNARLLAYEESVALLSKVRLGIVLGHFKGLDLKLLDDLIFKLHPKQLEAKQHQIGRKGEIIRAEFIQAHLG